MYKGMMKRVNNIKSSTGDGAVFRYKGYTFWKMANGHLDEERGLTIKDYVADYLKEKFPACRIIGQYYEFNKIDLYIVEEKLPIEIQATIKSEGNIPGISHFEKVCR